MLIYSIPPQQLIKLSLSRLLNNCTVVGFFLLWSLFSPAFLRRAFVAPQLFFSVFQLPSLLLLRREQRTVCVRSNCAAIASVRGDISVMGSVGGCVQGDEIKRKSKASVFMWMCHVKRNSFHITFRLKEELFAWGCSSVSESSSLLGEKDRNISDFYSEAYKAFLFLLNIMSLQTELVLMDTTTTLMCVCFLSVTSHPWECIYAHTCTIYINNVLLGEFIPF